MFLHTIARNIFPPVIRKFPSEMYYSKNLYSFSRIKQIKNFIKTNQISINYYVKKPTYLGTTESLDYCSVLDITHLDYDFVLKPLSYDSIRNEYLFPQRTQVEYMKKEFEYMLNYFKIQEKYDYFLVDDNIFINFTREEVN